MDESRSPETITELRDLAEQAGVPLGLLMRLGALVPDVLAQTSDSLWRDSSQYKMDERYERLATDRDLVRLTAAEQEAVAERRAADEMLASTLVAPTIPAPAKVFGEQDRQPSSIPPIGSRRGDRPMPNLKLVAPLRSTVSGVDSGLAATVDQNLTVLFDQQGAA